MDKKYTTIQQHEPLRVPSDWGAQEKRFVVQIEEILDDLYRRFNRIRLTDLNSELRGMIVESANGYSEIAQTAEQIQLRVQSIEGNYSTLTQTVTSFETRVSTVEGNYSTLTQTVSGFELRVLGVEGNYSTLTQTVNGLESKVVGKSQTFAQYEQPTGEINVGDLWVKTRATWAVLSKMTWESVHAAQWSDWCCQPTTYVWDGTQWLLTIDYNEVKQNSTEIKQTKDAVAIRATEKDPATYVKTSTVTVHPDGVDIESGGAVNVAAGASISLKTGGKVSIEGGASVDLTAGGEVNGTGLHITKDGIDINAEGALTVDADNFRLNAEGRMEARSASLEEAHVSGDIFVNGSPALSQKNIYIGSGEPPTPVPGMVWIRPNTSTSAQTTFSMKIPWGLRENLVNKPKMGELSGAATEAVGTAFTYRIKVPVYIGPSSSYGTTGAVLHFDIATTSGGAAVVSAEKNVTITDYGSGNKVIEMEVTGDSVNGWIGDNEKLYFNLYATTLAGYYAYDVLNSRDTSAAITVECISTATDGELAWRYCEVKCYS